MDQSNGPPRVDLLAGLRRSRELWQQQQQQQQNQQAARAPARHQPPAARLEEPPAAPPRTRLPAATSNGLRLNASAPLVPTSDTPREYATTANRGGKRTRSSTTTNTPRVKAPSKPRRTSSRKPSKKKRSYKRGGKTDHDVTSSDDDDDMPPSTPALDQALISDHEFSWRAVRGRRILTVSKAASSPSSVITHPLVLKASGGGASGSSRSSSVKVIGKAAHTFWNKVKKARLAYPQGEMAASNALRASYSIVPSPTTATSKGAATAADTLSVAASRRTQPAPIPHSTSAPSAAALRLMSAMKPQQQQRAQPTAAQSSNPLSKYFPLSSASSASALSRPQPTHQTVKQEVHHPIKQEMLSIGGARIKQEGNAVKQEFPQYGMGRVADREGSTGSTVSSTTMRQIAELEQQSRVARPRTSGEVQVVELLDSDSDDASCSSIHSSTPSSSSSHSSDTSVTSSEESSDHDEPFGRVVAVPPPQATATLFRFTTPPLMRSANTTTTTSRRDDSLLTLGDGCKRMPAQVDPRLGNVMRAEAVVPTHTSDLQRFHDEQDGGLLEATGFADDYGEGF